MAGGYFWPLNTGLQPLVHSMLIDKFIIPVYSPAEPGTTCHTRNQAVKGIKPGVTLKELWELEEDLTSQKWDNMNFSKDKNCNGLQQVKYD